MRRGVGVVRARQVVSVDGDMGQMNAASLAKQVIGHLAIALLDDLDEPIHDGITARHVLSHTSGLPNWRSGPHLTALRPPGQMWGYSGEGFVLLQAALESRTGATIDRLAARHVFGPLGMHDSEFDEPEPGFHGWRPLLTTAGDYATFLAHVLAIDDERWQPQCVLGDQLAWGAGWGLELGEPVHGWQWGSNADASNFVIGCPATGDGVVVFTDSARGVAAYEDIVRATMPGDRPSLDAWSERSWLARFS